MLSDLTGKRQKSAGGGAGGRGADLARQAWISKPAQAIRAVGQARPGTLSGLAFAVKDNIDVAVEGGVMEGGVRSFVITLPLPESTHGAPFKTRTGW